MTMIAVKIWYKFGNTDMVIMMMIFARFMNCLKLIYLLTSTVYFQLSMPSRYMLTFFLGSPDVYSDPCSFLCLSAFHL